MHKHHATLLAEIEKRQRKRKHGQANDSYLSSGHHYYDVSVPERRRLAKAWLKANRTVSQSEFISLIDSLVEGTSHEEKTMVCFLLAGHREHRAHVGPKELDRWLGRLVGWAEIDSLCQNLFTAQEMLGQWTRWERFLRALAKSRNINKRRASLVFLTGPVHYAKDACFSELAFETIERLKHEREIIITKAISWLLRSLVTNHKREVAAYIAENRDSLPAIAVRETLRKIKTGRK